MSNKSVDNKNTNHIIIYLILFMSLVTGFFFIYTLLHKKVNSIEIGNLEANIAGLNRQIYTFDRRLNTAATGIKYSKTLQIYNLIAESADYSEITMKSFIADKKTNNLEISLIGNFPKIIKFFKYLRQAKFNSIREIEIRNNSQDPDKSIEVLIKINFPTAKGVK